MAATQQTNYVTLLHNVVGYRSYLNLQDFRISLKSKRFIIMEIETMLGNVYYKNGKVVMALSEIASGKNKGFVRCLNSQYEKVALPVEAFKNATLVKQLEQRSFTNAKGVTYSYVKTKSGKVFGKSGNAVEPDKNSISAKIVALFA